MVETNRLAPGARITVLIGPEKGEHGTVFGDGDKLARGGAAGWPDYVVYLDSACGDMDFRCFSTDEITDTPAPPESEHSRAMVAWALEGTF